MNEFCKVYELIGTITQDDLDWMYNSGIDIQCERPYEEIDSGWCDYGTGREILTSKHKFTAFIKSEEEDTWLKLYWDDRAILTTHIYSTSIKYD